MLVSWGLLAFLKAADTRQNSSFAVRLTKKNEFQPAEDIGIYKAAPLDSDDVYKEPEVQEVKDWNDLF